MSEYKNRLEVVKETPGYWRVVITNGELNLFDPWMFAELNALMSEMERDDELKVVVFESGNEDFFMDHHDVEHRLIVPEQEGAAPFFYEWTNWVTRLAESRVISIAKVRGRARAQGFEFALACDMRFASKERAKFALIEVGGGSLPGGGGVEWLSRLVGRSRALEIVISSDDFDADTGERYGFVNRSVPDAELDAYVDKLARRIAGFEKLPLEMGKRLVNARAGVPARSELYTSAYILRSADSWDEVTKNHPDMVALGMNKLGEFELNLPKHLEDFRK